MKKTFLGFAALAALAVPAFAFDPAAFAQHLRETLMLDTRTPLEVPGGPVPSDIPSLNKVQVLVGGAPYDVYITKDEKTYFWGLRADATVSPDRQKMAAINTAAAPSIGSDRAPVTVVEYSDFACSHCKRAHDLVKEQLHKVYTPAQVRLVFKHYPLASHAWALPAAAAADCAAKQKPAAFWQMADYFFANQSTVNEANVKELALKEAARLGLKTAAIGTCMDSPAAREKVLAQKKEGATVGVNSTPTFFVNGRMRRGFRDFDDLKVVIDEKLKAAAK